MRRRSLLIGSLLLLATACHGDRPGVVQENDTVRVSTSTKMAYLASELPERFATSISVSHSLPSPATIQLAEKSCSCLGVDVPEGAVGPRKTAQIDVLLPNAAGSYSHVIYLDFCQNGREPFRKRVNLNYTVHADAEITPNRLVQEWSAKEIGNVEVRFVRRGRSGTLQDRNLKVTGLPKEWNLITIEGPVLTKLEDDLYEGEWTLSLAKKWTNEEPSNYIGIFSVGLDGDAPLTVQYDWVPPRNRVSITPQRVFFGTTPIGDKVVKRCVIATRDGLVPSINEIRSTSSCFGGVTLGKSGVIEVWYSPRILGPQEGSVTLHTDAADAPELKLTVSGIGDNPTGAVK